MNKDRQFRKGSKVKFKRVTRKYACRGGIIKERTVRYTDNTLKYPRLRSDSTYSTDVNFFDAPGPGRKAIACFYVDAINELGQKKETVLVTEGMLK